MKKTNKVFGFIVLTTIIALAFAACSDGSGGGPQKATYVSTDANGNKYTLEIQESGERSARSAAQQGDAFKLTVEYTTVVNGGELKMSFEYTGTIGAAQASGESVSLTLAINGETITITIVGAQMTVITGKIVDPYSGTEIVNNSNGTPVNGNTNNPFIGTWTGTGEAAGFTLVFTSNTNWSGLLYDEEGYGTYTYGGNNATLTDSGGTATAVVAGNTMTLTVDGVSLTLTKGIVNQTGPNPFTGVWTGTGLAGGSSIEFTSKYWQLYSGTNVTGTYTYNGNKATFINSDGGIFTGSISGDTLTIVRYGTSVTFTKGGGDPIGNVPSVPTGLSATAISSSEITITWNAVSGADGYIVYQGINAAGSYNPAGSTPNTTTANSNLPASTTVYYKVSAYNSYGESAQSGYVSATTFSSSGGGDIAEYNGNGHRYQIIEITMPWTEAKSYCEGIGGYLATITSAGEQEFVHNLISEKGNKNVYWLGGHCDSGRNFQWITGEPFEYANWRSGEPNNGGGREDKIQMLKNGGRWNDGENEYNPSDGIEWSVIGFVCEWGATAPPPPSDHRYELVEQSMTWLEAKAYCESRGGHLATITSQEEQDIVQALIANGTKKQYWLGGQATGSRAWVWVTAETWGYTNWARNEPNNSRGVESYLQMYRLPNPVMGATNNGLGFWNDISVNNTIAGEENFFSLEHIGIVIEFDNGESPPTTFSLDGIWQSTGRNVHVVTISGSSGVFNHISSVWQSAINAGNIRVGDEKFRNITKTGDTTWSCGERMQSGSSVFWENANITIAADGQSFTTTESFGGTGTWTRIGDNPTSPLDGVWQEGSTIITISGDSGVFTQISSSALWQSALAKGFVEVGDQALRNLTQTGNLTWTGQDKLGVTFNTSTPNVAHSVDWADCTITMNANGQTFQYGDTHQHGNMSGTFTRFGGDNTGPDAWSAAPNSVFGTTDMILRAAYGNGIWVAGGTSGKIVYSTDGRNWIEAPQTIFGSGGWIFDVAYGNGMFVAAGGTNRDNGSKMAYSTDGINWTAVERSPFSTSVRAIAYGNGTWVITSWNGNGGYSTDGISWTSVNVGAALGSGSSSGTGGIAYNGNKFVGVAVNGKIGYSSNGASWTAVSDSKFGIYDVADIAYGNNRFVAVGESGKVAYSTDGETWTAIADSAFGTTHITGIAYGDNMFVAVGNEGKAAYSPDGVTWTAIGNTTFGTTTIQDVAYGNGKFVAVGNEGKIAYVDE